eukprot:CAMPEP_0113845794 /NCGR_PEP_ID=MMETSP0372-20130328/955_1 /TAXON_ID=340204 /ORGANISM="Lankesteria abbotti" /LENGTH=264 /DNA_ID=CAMNT_0000814877 /DNA_START=181 /DNA_END=975 /DNA_ORIENTATION=+ /assembly_acc=CAM_ASM_000359
MHFVTKTHVEATFVPVPAMWAVYAGRAMIPLQFFVLFFLGMPVNVWIGVTFISNAQRPNFGFEKRGHLGLTHLAEPGMLGVVFDRPRADHGGNSDEMESLSADAGKMEGIRGYSSIFPDAKTLDGEKVTGATFFEPAFELQRHGSGFNSQIPRIVVIPSRSFGELSVREKIHLLNMLVYAASGTAYCCLAWHFYRKLGDAANEELRDPLNNSVSRYGGGEDFNSVHALCNNPLFTEPRPALQEPPAVWPFTCGGKRLGSDGSVG